jgi:hypothetical protein
MAGASELGCADAAGTYLVLALLLGVGVRLGVRITAGAVAGAGLCGLLTLGTGLLAGRFGTLTAGVRR